MNTISKTKRILMALMIFLLILPNPINLLSVNRLSDPSSDGPDDINVGYVIPFIIVNGLDPKARIFFGRYSLLTRRLEGNYHVRIAKGDSVTFKYPIQYLDLHQGVYFKTDQSSIRFSETTFDHPVNDIVKAYTYPPNSLTKEEILDNINKGNKEAGKIMVYEMNETLGTMTQ